MLKQHFIAILTLFIAALAVAAPAAGEDAAQHVGGIVASPLRVADLTPAPENKLTPQNPYPGEWTCEWVMGAGGPELACTDSSGRIYYCGTRNGQQVCVSAYDEGGCPAGPIEHCGQ